MSALPRKILFASTNKGKLSEVREIASRLGLEILSPDDVAVQLGAVPEVEEGVISYRENALFKAKAFYDWSHIPSLADDTGLEVDSLGGAPGVKSARFAGASATMAENKKLLLDSLNGVTSRTARFRCVLCLVVDNNSAPIYSEAVLEGEVAHVESGGGGFGYDSLFFVTGRGATLAELKGHDWVETHRYLAFQSLYR